MRLCLALGVGGKKRAHPQLAGLPLAASAVTFTLTRALQLYPAVSLLCPSESRWNCGQQPRNVDERARARKGTASEISIWERLPTLARCCPFSSKALRKGLLSGDPTNLRRQVCQVCHKMECHWGPAWRGAGVTGCVCPLDTGGYENKGGKRPRAQRSPSPAGSVSTCPLPHGSPIWACSWVRPFSSV